jgi:hypothetical protein
MTAKWDEYMRLEGWRDYYVIEAYQYVAEESRRSKVIREIEACRTADEAKAIIDKVRVKA